MMRAPPSAHSRAVSRLEVEPSSCASCGTGVSARATTSFSTSSDFSKSPANEMPRLKSSSLISCENVVQCRARMLVSASARMVPLLASGAASISDHESHTAARIFSISLRAQQRSCASAGRSSEALLAMPRWSGLNLAEPPGVQTKAEDRVA